jgi:hypothetical protein
MMRNMKVRERGRKRGREGERERESICHSAIDQQWYLELNSCNIHVYRYHGGCT